MGCVNWMLGIGKVCAFLMLSALQALLLGATRAGWTGLDRFGCFFQGLALLSRNCSLHQCYAGSVALCSTTFCLDWESWEMLQVLLVLTLELTLLPVLYGFWIDICGLQLTGSRLVSRFLFLEAAPVTWVIVHWILGMAFLMLTASFVSMIRGLLKPGQEVFYTLLVRHACAPPPLPP